MAEQPSVEEAFSALLASDDALGRGEPKVAEAIGEQLKHMELESLPLTLRRRIRDIVLRHRPQNIIEVGAGIGHLSAWLMDGFERAQPPGRYTLIEGGPKFGIILQRLLQRYEARDWSEVRAGRFQEIAAEGQGWLIANKALLSSSGDAAGEAPFAIPADCIIIDVGEVEQVECIRAALPLLSSRGLLLTAEPGTPLEGAEEAEVTRFEDWMKLISELQQSHRIGFLPLFGGNLVAFLSR